MKPLKKLILLILVLNSSACTEFQSSSSTGGSAGSASYSFLPAWSFIGYNNIESILRIQLALSESSTQEAAVFNYLRAHQSDLGVGNFSVGIPDNIRPEPIKFRYLTEIMSDACFLGLLKPQVHGSLFPLVTDTSTWTSKSFDVIYLKILGRKPSSEESAALLELVQAIPSSTPTYHKKATAVCSVVLSSIEAANSR